MQHICVHLKFLYARLEIGLVSSYKTEDERWSKSYVISPINSSYGTTLIIVERSMITRQLCVFSFPDSKLAIVESKLRTALEPGKLSHVLKHMFHILLSIPFFQEGLLHLNQV
jgi:hypothetical protein